MSKNQNRKFPTKVDSFLWAQPWIQNWVNILPFDPRVWPQMHRLKAGLSMTSQTVSAMNAACNIYSNVTYNAYRPTWTAEEGDLASFSWGPGAGFSAQNMSRPTIGRQTGHQAFP